MLTLGFAHVGSSVARAVGAEATSTDAVVMALFDGAAPPICGKTAPAAPAGDHNAICGACLLTAAPGALPAPAPVIAAPALIARLAPVFVLALAADEPIRAPRSRGPPQA